MQTPVCILCGVTSEPIDDHTRPGKARPDVFGHPAVEDCDAQYLDVRGVPCDAIPERSPRRSLLADFLPDGMPSSTPVDQALPKAFEALGEAYLGGISTGRGWSSFSKYQACPYAWKRTYLEGIRFDIEPVPLAFGSLVHAYLAVHYRRMMPEPFAVTPIALRDELLKLGVAAAIVLDSWALFQTYLLRWTADNWIPLTVEHGVVDPLSNASCRYDAIVYLPEPQGTIPAGTFIVEHKCLHADEVLFDEKTGRRWTVRELAEARRAPVLLAYDERTHRLGHAQAAIPVATTRRDSYATTLRSGRRVRTSANHPFLTARGWVPAAELTVNDWVAVTRPDITAKRGPARLTNYEIDFVGLMLGDGCTSNWTFTKQSAAVRKRFFTAASRIAGAPKHRVSDQRAPSIQVTARRDGGPHRLMARLGLLGKLAADKFIPEEMLRMSSTQSRRLLGALWDTDGCIEAPTVLDRPKPRLAYVSRSRMLCEGIQTLLTDLGFVTTLTMSSAAYKGGRHAVATLKITTHASKRRFLQEAIDGLLPVTRWSPAQLTTILATISPKDDDGVPLTYLRAIGRSPYLPSQSGQTVERWKCPDDPRLADLRWERVKTVEIEAEQAMMYDITVPGPHTFVVNGIVTHNTAGRFDDATLNGWANDGEILGQQHLYERLGLKHRFGPLQGTIINILGKQKAAQFHRTYVPVVRATLKTHAADLRHWESLIQVAMATGKFPRARQSCVGRYGRCSHWDHCTTGEG
jgi:hypothetical protein